MALSGGQKFCLFVMIMGGLAIIASSAAPFWAVLEGAGSKISFGAWYYCTDTPITDTDCDTYKWGDADLDDFSTWFYVFHVLEGLASLLGLILVLISLLMVCGNTDSAKGTAGLGLITGALGIGAAVVLYVKMSDSLENRLVSEDDVGWAFYVACTGSGLLALFSVVLLALPNANRISAY